MVSLAKIVLDGGASVDALREDFASKAGLRPQIKGFATSGGLVQATTTEPVLQLQEHSICAPLLVVASSSPLLLSHRTMKTLKITVDHENKIFTKSDRKFPY
eukprot:GHVP01018354.1.p1 GENE.GHVP01018354.1~~GHVP01018354.1.p1  ORF type:complete len:102 (+),score=20.46 GHVP01018354.1:105-410(+)